MLRRFLLIGLVILVVLSTTGLALADPAIPEQADLDDIEATWIEGTYVPDEVLVQFKADADAERIAEGVGARIERQTALGVKVLKVPAGTVKPVIALLRGNPNVEYAEPNGIGHVFVEPNDPYYATCYPTAFYGWVVSL
jgi:hypothetical protein